MSKIFGTIKKTVESQTLKSFIARPKPLTCNMRTFPTPQSASQTSLTVFITNFELCRQYIFCANKTMKFY